MTTFFEQQHVARRNTHVMVVLFVLAFFVLIIPRFQAILLERKKEMIRELMNIIRRASRH